MWVLTSNGEKAVNLDRATRLTIDHKDKSWHVIAWTPERGDYVFESGSVDGCREWINSMTAKMNGRIM